MEGLGQLFGHFGLVQIPKWLSYGLRFVELVHGLKSSVLVGIP